MRLPVDTRGVQDDPDTPCILRLINQQQSALDVGQVTSRTFGVGSDILGAVVLLAADASTSALRVSMDAGGVTASVDVLPGAGGILLPLQVIGDVTIESAAITTGGGAFWRLYDVDTDTPAQAFRQPASVGGIVQVGAGTGQTIPGPSYAGGGRLGVMFTSNQPVTASFVWNIPDIDGGGLGQIRETFLTPAAAFGAADVPYRTPGVSLNFTNPGGSAATVNYTARAYPA